MARHSAREIGRIESTYTSDLGQLTWAWVLKADGRVLYRLSHINGRPERNYWRIVYQLSATERWQIEQDSGRGLAAIFPLPRARLERARAPSAREPAARARRRGVYRRCHKVHRLPGRCFSHHWLALTNRCAIQSAAARRP